MQLACVIDSEREDESSQSSLASLNEEVVEGTGWGHKHQHKEQQEVELDRWLQPA